MVTRPAWGGRLAAGLTAACLARDRDPATGVTPCHHCGAPATTADHYPVARIDGAPDTLAALVSSCGPCNFSAGARLGNQRRALGPPPSRRW